MTPREIREHLGRVKTYYLRNESTRALASAISGLQGIGASAPGTDIRSTLREAVQMLARDPQIAKYVKAPLTYQPGQEKALLASLVTAYKAIRAAAEEEDRAATLARKIRLDQNFNLGIKLLEQGKVSEADASFAEALKSYKDEHRLFALIGKALMGAGEVRRALPYLKRGAEANPNDADMAAQLEECTRKREAL